MFVTICLTIVAFLSGSCMFSYWIGRLFGHDIRNYGDGNPGAINAFHAGGFKVGIIAGVFDFLKGAIPVFLATNRFGISDVRLLPIAVAPVIGHAFSPFLKFKGGKTIAVTFGIWSGLTLWEVPVLLGGLFSIFTWLINIKEDGWKVVLGMCGVLFYLIFAKSNTVLTSIMILNLLIIIYTHWSDLSAPMRIRLPFRK